MDIERDLVREMLHEAIQHNGVMVRRWYHEAEFRADVERAVDTMTVVVELMREEGGTADVATSFLLRFWDRWFEDYLTAERRREAMIQANKPSYVRWELPAQDERLDG